MSESRNYTTMNYTTKVVAGMHIPATDPEAWLRDCPVVDGYPAYQYDRLNECLAVLTSMGRPMDTCIDGGAHVGTWTVHLAKHFRRVLAFEPIDVNVKCLHLNVYGPDLENRCNVHVHVWPYALSTRSETLLIGTKGRSWDWAVGKGNHSISGVRLDALNGQNVDLIKLDVEGWEYNALMGAQETLRRCSPVVIIEEKHDREFRASQLLEGLGYRLHMRFRRDKIYVK